MTARCVLLRHQLDDGTGHFDWMIERPACASRTGAPDDRVLLTFRVRERIDDPACGAFLGERIGDHRRAYLDHEGPVAGGRGHVARVASGMVARLVEREDTIEIVMVWNGGVSTAWRGRPVNTPDAWTFARVEAVG